VTHHRSDQSNPDRVIPALIELVDALDRRVPRVERVGEIRIAREAAALRKEALARIEELKRAGVARQAREAVLANAVMTDDGGATPKDEGATPVAAGRSADKLDG